MWRECKSQIFIIAANWDCRPPSTPSGNPENLPPWAVPRSQLEADFSLLSSCQAVPHTTNTKLPASFHLQRRQLRTLPSSLFKKPSRVLNFQVLASCFSVLNASPGSLVKARLPEPRSSWETIWFPLVPHIAPRWWSHPLARLYQASEELIGKAGWELTSER